MRRSPVIRDPAPALLTVADYCGTLAAARCLGEAGAKVTVADPGRLGPAKWSRSVARRLACPPYVDSDRLLAWLLDFGAREPGHVLYPTCDDYAWLIARHADELGRHFHLYSPPVEVVESLLDKRSLGELCARAGIESPPAWFPSGEADLATVAASARFPLLLKQRTQILSDTHTKGLLVEAPEQLAARFLDFVERNRFGRAIMDRRPDLGFPLLQEYFPEAADGSLLVAGFIDHTGQHFAARASNKLLQVPPRLGIALVLEPAPLDPGLADRIARLCRLAGYHGVFQMEFLRRGGHHLLIDFNPRYYHHLAYEIARGLPIPILAHLAATGRHAELADAVAASVAAEDLPPDRLFTHRTQLDWVLRLRRLAGRETAEGAARWRMRCRDAVDAVRARSDLWPAFLDALLLAGDWGRSPRSTIARMVADA